MIGEKPIRMKIGSVAALNPQLTQLIDPDEDADQNDGRFDDLREGRGDSKAHRTPAGSCARGVKPPERLPAAGRGGTHPSAR